MTDLSDDESSLVSRLRAGDAAAFASVMRIHAPRLLRLAERILGSAAEAEDTVQEALVSAWRNLAQFDGRAALGTWLHRITVNAALLHLRRQARRNEVSMNDEAADDPGSLPLTPGAPDADREQARLVWRAIDALPGELRAVLVLRDFEELPSKEVAAALAISDALVRQRLHRARQAVAEQLRPALREAPHVTCGGNLDLLFDLLDDTLAPAVEAPVVAHVRGCGVCQGLREDYRDVARIERGAATHSWSGPAIDALVRSVVARLASP